MQGFYCNGARLSTENFSALVFESTLRLPTRAWWQAGPSGKRQDEQRQKTGGSVASCRQSRGLAHAGSAIRGLELEVSLDELAETFAGFVTNVDEFDVGAFVAAFANIG